MTHMLHLVKIEDGDYLTFRVECPGTDDRTCKMYVDGESGCRCSDVNCPCYDGDDEDQDHWACRHYDECGGQHWLDETSPADCIHGDLVGPGPWPIDVEWRDEWGQFIIRSLPTP